MTQAIQPVSLAPFNLTAGSAAGSLPPLQMALTLKPDLVAQSAQEVMMTNSGMNHLTKSTSAQGLNPLSGVVQHSDAEIKEVAKNFESLFLQMLFKEMRNTVEKSNLFGDSQATEFFESMHDEDLAKQVASSGGIGIGNMVYQRLKEVTLPHQKIFS